MNVPQPVDLANRGPTILSQSRGLVMFGVVMFAYRMASPRTLEACPAQAPQTGLQSPSQSTSQLILNACLAPNIHI